ncbi:MAG: hypothetical protein AAF639_42540 [Chloroflexota bacterium]
MDYGPILSDSWSFVWRNRIMWLLGFLAALGSGGSGGSGGNFNFNTNSGSFDIPGANEPDSETIRQIERLMQSLAEGNWPAFNEILASLIGVTLPTILMLIAFVVMIFIGLWIIGLVARVGLITLVYPGKEPSESSIDAVVRVGLQSFWRLLGLKIILFLIPIAVIFGLAFFAIMSLFFTAFADAVSSNDASAAFAVVPALMCCFVCLFVPGALLLTFIDAFAFRGIVIKNMGIFEAVGHGWAVSTRNLGRVLVLGFIFLVIGLIFGFIISLAILGPLFVILMATAGDSFSFTDITTIPIILIAIGVIAVMVIGAAISALLVAWQSAAFTMLYVKLTGTHPQHTIQDPSPNVPLGESAMVANEVEQEPSRGEPPQGDTDTIHHELTQPPMPQELPQGESTMTPSAAEEKPIYEVLSEELQQKEADIASDDVEQASTPKTSSS